MVRFSLILVSTGLVGGLLGGCSGSSSSGGPAPVPKSQFKTRFESAVCDNIGGCCKSAGYAYDAAKCKQAIDQSLTGLLDSTYTTYDAQAAGTCLDAISTATSSCKGFDVLDSVCMKTFVGARAPGQPCVAPGDCAPVAGVDVSCEYTATAGGGGSSGSGGSSGNSQGTCVVKPIGKKGDSCDETCITYGGASACGPGLGNGGSSGGNARCYTDDGLYCGDNGMCDALVPIGQSCAPAGLCVLSAYCNSNYMCVAKGSVGSPCTQTHCKYGTYCAGIDASGNGTCANVKPAGASCSTPEACQSGECQNGKCTSSSYGVTAGLCSGQTSGGSGGTGGTGGGTGGTGAAFNGSGG